MKWRRIPRARFREMLEIMWPAYWNSKGFLVGEPWDHGPDGLPRYAPFRGDVNGNGPFYEGSAPMSIPEFRKLTGDKR